MAADKSTKNENNLLHYLLSRDGGGEIVEN